MRKFLLLAATGLGLVGCASAKLDIAVDIYGKDAKPQAETDARELDQIAAVTAAAKASAVELADQYRRLTKDLREIVDLFLAPFADSLASDSKATMERMIVAEENDIKRRELAYVTVATDVIGQARIARTILTAKDPDRATCQRLNDDARKKCEVNVETARADTEKSKATTRQAFDAKVHTLMMASTGYASDMASSFEKNLSELLSALVEDFGSNVANLRAAAKDSKLSVEKRKQLDAELDKKLTAIEASFNVKVVAYKQHVAVLNARSAPSAGDRPASNTPEARLIAAINRLGNVKFVQAAASHDRRTVRELAQSMEFYTSQIDRLQNPSDPAWREVLDPKNEKHWHKHFAHTAFYAEGKTSTIIVRDQLGHFRVQKGENDPTALIRNQLNITRSIASGALQVAGTAAGAFGVPLKIDLPHGRTTKEGEPVVPEAPSSTKLESLPVVEATHDAMILRRSSMRSELATRLKDFKKRIDDGTEPAKLESLKGEVLAYLRIEARLFDPSLGEIAEASVP